MKPYTGHGAMVGTWSSIISYKVTYPLLPNHITYFHGPICVRCTHFKVEHNFGNASPFKIFFLLDLPIGYHGEKWASQSKNL